MFLDLSVIVLLGLSINQMLLSYNASEYLVNQTVTSEKTEPDSVSAPPPPPPPPPPTSAAPSPQPLKRSQSRQSLMSTKSSSELMQEELSSVLNLVRENQRHLDIKQTPESYINQKSSPSEVKEWLNKKGFSTDIQDKFKGVTGYQILDISKQELEKIGGQDGKRLYSQLNIQKSVSGFQTVRTTELKAILAKARRKFAYVEE